MIKSELVDLLAARNPYLHRRDAENAVDAVLDEITGALERGDRVEIRGFGTFVVRHRPARSGRNPLNGNAVFVEEKWVPFFRAGKEIKDRLNIAEEPRGKE
ncbi:MULTISPECIES: integration host factor subunit beta [Agrobacterium]|uniref:Integration host factor subunit beta n=2 Tax=Agrobacterium tumefaciens complex TaxID=1183400 RepID=A0AAE6BJD4_AGRTU|nr:MULTISPECIES: integration host factor subunit beta [Agrobacterium]ASK40655.1 integration host factor subunit beta [Agrobacterium genomosp. 6]ASK41419.1 integration host factor subunit beta [Agrobacterium genomosp. 6]QCL77538.1 integration host factor subunit beta [Agrobacterium tumefaciens]QCL83026.1 integration host factor subunit beta [Agrobacterium tumefaciens]CUX71448.1 Integration host factor beta-subunit (IHF-beta) [Agrobacterium sp. NCPPB 925]